MTAARYVSQIVEPTITEAQNEPQSVRRAVLARLVTFHILDYVVSESTKKNGGDLRRRFQKKSPAFLEVDRVAHACKHVQTGHPKGRVKPMAAGDIISVPAAVSGAMESGLQPCGYAGGTGIVGEHIDLLPVISEAKNFLISQIELKDGDTGSRAKATKWSLWRVALSR